MKRICSMCKNEYRYDKVHLWKPTRFKICNECQNMICDIVRVDIDRYGL